MFRRCLLLLVVLLPLAVEGYYYINGWLAGRETSVLVMYRPTTGDRDYFPIVHQLAKLQTGEGYTPEFRGTGFISFPWASLLPHALAMAALGPVGFAIADLLVPCGYCALLALLLMRAGAAQTIAWGLAVFTTLFGFEWLGRVLLSVFGDALHGLSFYLNFLQSWNLRFPRPFVSGLFVLGAGASWMVLVRGGWPSARGWWLAVGAWMAAVLQSDIYSFAVLGLLYAGAAIAWLIAGRHWPSASQLRNLALCLVLFVLLATPFLLARWLEHPDLPARFGVFKLPGSPLALIGMVLQFFPKSFLVASLILPLAACLALRRRSCWDDHLLPHVATALVAMQLAGYAAMFAQVSATGKAVQLFQYRDTARCFVSLSVIATVALFVTGLLARNKEKKFRLRNVVLASAAALVALGVLRHSFFYGRLHLDNPGTPRAMGGRSLGTSPPAWATSYRPVLAGLVWLRHFLGDARPQLDNPAAPPSAGVSPPTDVQSYRRDFEALSGFLTAERNAGAESLATLEVELYSWWTAFRDGSSFLPRAFVSTLPNSELESRLCQFAKYNGLTAETFLAFLEYPSVNNVINNWQSEALYQANASYTFAPINDYSPEQRARIAKAGILDGSLIEIPLSEQRRLKHLFESTALPRPGAGPKLDLLVLTDEFPQLQPDPEYFVLVYRNPTFRAYRFRPSPATRPPT